MHLNDCEISSREVRGQRLVVLYGPRAITAAEGSALLSRYYATHTGAQPVYASPAGWQTLEPVGTAEPAAVAEPVSSEPAAEVAADPPSAKAKAKTK